MSIKTQYQTLFAYHWHTNWRILAGVAHLEEETFLAATVYGRGSIHGLLFHILNTDRSWRLALETGQQQGFLPAEDYRELASLRAGLEAEQQAWAVLLEAFTPDEIEAAAELTDRRGRTFPVPRWRVMQHVILHGMQHHAELAQLLTEHGHSPGDIDFIFFRDET